MPTIFKLCVRLCVYTNNKDIKCPCVHGDYFLEKVTVLIMEVVNIILAVVGSMN